MTWTGQEAFARTLYVHPTLGSIWRNAGRRTWNWSPPENDDGAAVFGFKTMKAAKAHAVSYQESRPPSGSEPS